MSAGTYAKRAGTYAKRAAKGGVRSGDGRRAAGRTRHLLERVDSRKVSLLQVGVGEHPALDRVAHPARALECHPKPHTCRIVAVAHVEEDWLLERLVQRRRGEGGAGASEGTVEVSHICVCVYVFAQPSDVPLPRRIRKNCNLSSPALDVRLMTALQVLQVPYVRTGAC